MTLDLANTRKTCHSVPALESPRRIVMLTFPNAELLDTVGPLEVFSNANVMAKQKIYDVVIVAPSAGPITMRSGLTLEATLGFEDDLGEIDTLLIAGGVDVSLAASNLRVQDWLRHWGAKARRLCSICTGAYLLASAGYLKDRRATTHWLRCRDLAERYPDVQVEPDAIFLRDGKVATSAGITAGLDLALHLLEEDYGRVLSVEVARFMVVFARRQGGQLQFSRKLRGEAWQGGKFAQLGNWVLQNLGHDLRVENLAKRAGASERSFSRQFRTETGMSPSRFVELARLDAARNALESSDDPIEKIALRLGFGHAETMRRQFHKHLSMGPRDYRHRWAESGQVGSGFCPFDHVALG